MPNQSFYASLCFFVPVWEDFSGIFKQNFDFLVKSFGFLSPQAKALSNHLTIAWVTRPEYPKAQTELQNVNLFTRSKTFKPNFTRKKARKLRPFWHQNWQKGYFWKTDVDDSVKDESLDRDISDRLCKSPPKKLHCAKLCENTVLPNFYPNLPKILHGYICDILQLWARRTKSSRPVGPSTRSRGPKTSGRNFLEANKFSLRESQYKSQSQSRGFKV